MEQQAEKEHKICEKVFSLAGSRDAEVIISSSESALTRFADNVISQNVSGRSTDIIIRVMESGRVGRVSINNDGEEHLRHAVDSALAMLTAQKADSALMPLPDPVPVKENGLLYFESTASFSPADRASKISAVAAMCASCGRTASGILDNGWSRVTVANSRGVLVSHAETEATFSVTVRDGSAMGWAEEYVADIGRLDFESVAGRASEKAGMARNPVEIKPGRYAVVLEPDPVANMLFFSAIYGFGGQFFLEGQSFMAGRLGQKVLGGNITITDNALDGPGSGMPFDFEGMPRKKVMLVENGMAMTAVHDRRTSGKAGVSSTGHALPSPNTYGPIPSNLSLKPGGSSLEDMIKSTERGLLVTQFHYVNVLKPVSLELTGMTRNGTYLIENGRITGPVRNMRFTESVVEALGRVEAIGAKPSVTAAFFGGKFLVPPMKIRDFNFSSVTGF
ncbi:MAG: TldD/PmbA family protein [bacterium]